MLYLIFLLKVNCLPTVNSGRRYFSVITSYLNMYFSFFNNNNNNNNNKKKKNE